MMGVPKLLTYSGRLRSHRRLTNFTRYITGFLRIFRTLEFNKIRRFYPLCPSAI
jgi:hypothetical protein